MFENHYFFKLLIISDSNLYIFENTQITSNSKIKLADL